MYAIYNDQVFRLALVSNKLFLISNKRLSGFTNAIDIFGKEIDDLYEKEVTEDSLQSAYELFYDVQYKGRRFETLTNITWLRDKGLVQIETKDTALAKELGFQRFEIIVFMKEIPLEEIENLIEIKKPVLKFKSVGVTETVIPKESIIQYLQNLID
jgi:hypothetical protein